MLHSPEVIAIPAVLEEILAKLMPAATFVKMDISKDCLPAVFMETPSAVHGFAVGEEEDYQTLYEAFKKYFLGRGAAWTAKDASFVFCLPAGHETSEVFHSKVEVDVYFCRKYVIQLGSSLETSLSRLPFLPLAPVAGGHIRPPTAKTLLRQRKVKAELANALIEPGTAAATILGNCLDGKYGPTNLFNQSAEASLEVKSEQREQAILKSISIENFRAYRKKKDFELGTAVTVLYGPNGFGKTSFFDAVDFAVTGGIGRLEKPSGGLAKIAKHLDSKDEPTQVCLKFERAGKTHVIKRDLTSPNDATLDGKVVSRKGILTSLTGGDAAPADRVENLVSLFRATHLFSQDRQELTREVANSCTLQTDIVSRMLAFEDYVTGLKKVNEVLKLAKQEHERAVGQIGKAKLEVSGDVAELQRLEGLQAAATSPEILRASFDELEKAILDGDFELSGVSVHDTRSLRTFLEVSSIEAAGRRTALANCLEHVINIRLQSAHIVPLQTQKEEARATAENAEAVVIDAGRRVHNASSEAERTKSAVTNAKNLRDWLLWAISMKPESTGLSAEIQAHSARLKSLAELVGIHRQTLSHMETISGEAQAAVVAAESRVTAEQTKRSRVQRAEAMLDTVDSITARLVVLRGNEAQLQQELEALQEGLDEPNHALLSQKAVVTRLESQLAEARSQASKLRGLVAELRSHIHGSTCVFCGHDHGNRQALLAAVDSRMEQAELITQLSDSLFLEAEKLRVLEQQHAARVTSSNDLEQRSRTAHQERVRLEHQLAECQTIFSAIGLSIGAPLFATQLTEAVAQSRHDFESAQATANSSRNVFSTAQSDVLEARQTYATTESERKSVTELLNEAKRRLDEILGEAQRGAINLELPLGALQDMLGSQEAELGKANELQQIASVELENQRAAQSAAMGQASAASTAHQNATRAWNIVQRNVESRFATLVAVGLDAKATEEHVHDLMMAAQARELAALTLRDKAAELEVATDASATSAAFQSIRARILRNESIAKEAGSRTALLEPWIKYFDGVAKLLSGQQAMATEHFTNGYGPRTEMIQRRLRPVYGFNNIAVTSKDSSIQIHVSRNGENLRPTDFFSQSQVQTLVLGLFLTACSSQTWSGFSSIMMDDPVTHFDNLNTYALLDLILGLHSSQEGTRQFVISTCDEKLLQLARHKFRHLGEAAKFYRFSAIGGEGPLVAEIPA